MVNRQHLHDMLANLASAAAEEREAMLASRQARKRAMGAEERMGLLGFVRAKMLRERDDARDEQTRADDRRERWAARVAELRATILDTYAPKEN